jgi:N-acetylglucosaminyl-diphospho-decaprenol L-rhamnosyltransferase
MPTARSVALVIVTYKSAALTIACLESLVPERRAPGIELRVVVVDNASGDAPEVADIVRANGWVSWITVIEAPRNGGFAYGNNLGFAYACQNGAPDYLHLLNPDTRVTPGAIAALIEFLESHPDAGIAGSSFENSDGTKWPIAFRFPSLLSEIDNGLRLGIVSRMLSRWTVARTMSCEAQPIDWGAGASMMIRRSLLESIGGFDENFFLYFEETEFCWRAKRAGVSMWYVPRSRVVHIAGQSTKVTERRAASKRLPGYWFESRRRYFLCSGSLARALCVDCAAILAASLGALHLLLRGRRSDLVPNYIGDLCRYSVLRRQNRFCHHPKTCWRDHIT